MPCPAVKYSDKSKAVEKQFVISRVNTYVSRAPCWSDSCPRRTREKIMKRPYLVVCTLLLSLCQDRTTASWMLVPFFFPFCVLCFHWNQKQKRYKLDGNIILAWFWPTVACSCLSFCLVSRWMGISALSTRSNGNLTTCGGVPDLSSQQRNVCENKPDLIPTLRQGASLGISECQKQFEKERWNCSTTNSSSVFGEVINIGKWMLLLIRTLVKFPRCPNKLHLSRDRKSRGSLRVCNNISWRSSGGQ